MGEYALNIPMISIPMVGIDVVLGFQWLESLGIVDFISRTFHEVFLLRE